MDRSIIRKPPWRTCNVEDGVEGTIPEGGRFTFFHSQDCLISVFICKMKKLRTQK